jgi:hypothetical protein
MRRDVRWRYVAAGQTTPAAGVERWDRVLQLPFAVEEVALLQLGWTQTLDDQQSVRARQVRLRLEQSMPGKRGFDIELGGRRGLARLLDRLSWPQQSLGRDAGPVGALASHKLTLDHGDPQAALGQSSRAVLRLPCAWAARFKASARSLTDSYFVLIDPSDQRPGSRVLISWSNQALPSGSLNEANEP